jgi:hypothetical protein
LPSIVDIFSSPYEVWLRRDPTREELTAYMKEHGVFLPFVNVKLLKVVDSALVAAEHMAEVSVDNELGFFIENALENSTALVELRSKMPPGMLPGLSAYQSDYPTYDSQLVDQEISRFGTVLAEGQFLFHGGHWPIGQEQFVTDRPLSTTFCPQVALRNAEWNAKAYDAGWIDLIVLRVTAPQSKAYLYPSHGELKHEKEIVFATGARLRLLSRKKIADKTAYKGGTYNKTITKTVPVYVLEAEIS